MSVLSAFLLGAMVGGAVAAFAVARYLTRPQRVPPLRWTPGVLHVIEGGDEPEGRRLHLYTTTEDEGDTIA